MAGEDRPKPEQDASGRFLAGNSGNGGRQKGARNKLADHFVEDVYAAWKTSGAQAITDMIADKPGDFVKMVGSLLPKDVNLNLTDNRELSDDELIERVRSLTAAVAPLIAGRAGAGTEAIRLAKPSGLH
jgi:hypothetical protein